MTERLSAWSRLLASYELPLVLTLAAIGFFSILLNYGGISLSSDALNHHFYLGWVAGQPRFQQDFLAASYQSYQFPYLYWPVYFLASQGVSGFWAGVVLTALHLLAVPPAWMLARQCMPGHTRFDALMRLLGVMLAFMSSAILLLLTTTSNDLLAAIPLLWALALAVEPLASQSSGWMTSWRCLRLSGAFAGAAIAFKLSNGPIAILLPGLWWMAGRGGWGQRLWNVLIAGLITIFTFFVCYGFWGWHLWKVFGNPIYPMYDGLFVAPRMWLDWTP